MILSRNSHPAPVPDYESYAPHPSERLAEAALLEDDAPSEANETVVAAKEVAKKVAPPKKKKPKKKKKEKAMEEEEEKVEADPVSIAVALNALPAQEVSIMASIQIKFL